MKKENAVQQEGQAPEHESKALKTATKRDFLKKQALKSQYVPVPEWGVQVKVQEMSGAQRAQFDTWVVNQEEGAPKLTMVQVVACTAVDEEGRAMFSDLDIPDLMQRSGDILWRIAEVGCTLSGIGILAKEDATKNSEPDSKDDSLSD